MTTYEPKVGDRVYIGKGRAEWEVVAVDGGPENATRHVSAVRLFRVVHSEPELTHDCADGDHWPCTAVAAARAEAVPA